MMDFTGKVVLVTGGASGIGLTTAVAFADHGAQVIVADIADPDAAPRSERVHFVRLDVRDEPGWSRVTADILQRFGRLDVLVNGAGVVLNASIEDTSLAEFRRVYEVNVEGVFLGSKAAIAAMKPQRAGVIINISSVAGMRGVAKLAAYNAAKGAVRLLTKSVALHCAEKDYGIRCVSVHPSHIDTPMVRREIATARDPARMLSVFERVSPMKRMGRPEEVAAMILFLASDEASFVNGAEIPIDGGTLAR